MLVFDNDKAIILDSIHTPTPTDHIWVLDLNILDFTLTPLSVLEEIIGPSIELMISEFRFTLPANWNILVCDPESMQLDVVEIKDIAGKEFRVLLYGHNHSRAETAVISATDYFPSAQNVGPSLSKHQMLCHPVAPQTWINVAPSDTYNKYLKNRCAGDLI
jgi:hypothetical protein